MAVLQDEPFLLEQGDPVIARVSATNQIGTSDFSDLNSITGLIQTVPGKPPTEPSRGPLTTTSQIHVQIGELSLEESGGSPVLSYEITYDKGTA